MKFQVEQLELLEESPKISEGTPDEIVNFWIQFISEETFFYFQNTVDKTYASLILK